MRKPNFDYAKAKRELRKLVRMGVSKRQASVMAGVTYQTAMLWTPDIHTPKGDIRISGISLKILKELVSTGYYFPNNNLVSNNNLRANFSYRILRKNFPVKKVKVHGLSVYVMRGSERIAMQEMLKKLNLKSVGWQKLALIRNAFGIKSMEDDNRFMGRPGS